MKSIAALSIAFCFALAQSAVGGDISDINQGIQGAESQVSGALPNVAKTADQVFKDLGVTRTGVNIQDSGRNETLSGKKGDLSVEVKLNQTTSSETHVGIVAKRGTFNWDKDFAKEVLSRIMRNG